MSYKNQIIEKILIEWAYRVDNGMPNPKNKEHISILSEVLSDLGLSEIKNEFIDSACVRVFIKLSIPTLSQCYIVAI